VGESLWATAQVTHFTQPGWQFLNSGSGYLAGTESNGSYVWLKSTNGRPALGSASRTLRAQLAER
jgi:hypothetical protein